jgi:hypothetical protein
MKKSNLINSYVGRRVIISFAGILFAIACLSQARAQADVNITSVTVTADKRVRPTVVETPPSKTQPGQPAVRVIPPPEVLRCSVTVHSYWDDDASQAMLVVVVPVEVSIVSHPPNAVVYKAGGTSPWAGYIVFSLGDMAVQQKITVEFTFTKSTTGNNKVSAYAYSATPDPNPSNNYKDASY